MKHNSEPAVPVSVSPIFILSLVSVVVDTTAGLSDGTVETIKHNDPRDPLCLQKHNYLATWRCARGGEFLNLPALAPLLPSSLNTGIFTVDDRTRERS